MKEIFIKPCDVNITGSSVLDTISKQINDLDYFTIKEEKLKNNGELDAVAIAGLVIAASALTFNVVVTIYNLVKQSRLIHASNNNIPIDQVPKINIEITNNINIEVPSSDLKRDEFAKKVIEYYGGNDE